MLLNGIFGFPLVVICLHLATTKTNGAPTRRTCPTSFYLYRRHYDTCSRHNWGGSLPLTDRRIMTGWHLLKELKHFCSTVPLARECFRKHYDDCQEDLVSILDESLAKSTWMCDQKGLVRSSISGALMAANSSARGFETAVRNCIIPGSGQRCIDETVSRFPFLRRHKIKMSISELMGNPQSTEYFYAMFKCAFEKMKVQCPHNALVMTLAEQEHMLLPPKFAINVSDIILQTTKSV